MSVGKEIKVNCWFEPFDVNLMWYDATKRLD